MARWNHRTARRPFARPPTPFARPSPKKVSATCTLAKPIGSANRKVSATGAAGRAAVRGEGAAGGGARADARGSDVELALEGDGEGGLAGVADALGDLADGVAAGFEQLERLVETALAHVRAGRDAELATEGAQEGRFAGVARA